MSLNTNINTSSMLPKNKQKNYNFHSPFVYLLNYKKNNKLFVISFYLVLKE